MAVAVAMGVRSRNFESLRDFPSALDERSLVHRINVPVEKDKEVGGICRENFDKFGPALIFNRVGSYKTPLCVGTLGNRERYALALDIEPTTDAISAKWREAYAHPIKARTVLRSEASCKEVVIAASRRSGGRSLQRSPSATPTAAAAPIYRPYCSRSSASRTRWQARVERYAGHRPVNQ